MFALNSPRSSLLLTPSLRYNYDSYFFCPHVSGPDSHMGAPFPGSLFGSPRSKTSGGVGSISWPPMYHICLFCSPKSPKP